jgi:penicillin amidase
MMSGRRWLKALGTVLAVVGMAIFGVVWILRSSLPLLDGERIVSAARSDVSELGTLQQPVVLQRDAEGNPTVRASNLPDLAFGLGFLHAQDRFFQMDLSRRLAAGELAALVGERALDQDRQTRVFRLRRVAREAIADASPDEREWIEAYTRGVNEGLAALGSKPWEYHLLRQQPAAWRAEDSILVIHAMWWQLQSEGLRQELPRRRLLARLAGRDGSPAMVTPAQAQSLLMALYPRANDWDTPNFTTLESARAVVAPAANLPSLGGLNLRELADTQRQRETARISLEADEAPMPGSNAWAVAGPHADAGGAALIAGDMHLGLRIPTVWYRARLVQGEAEEGGLELNGVTLPGLPAVAAGSNGYVAWSFTNSYGDWVDVRDFRCDAESYESSEGRRSFQLINEFIEVAHGESVPLDVKESPDGIVVGEEPLADGSTRCWLARWLITEPGATNLRSMALQQVKSLDAALRLAPSVGIPHQNFIVGDRSGRIAWTIIGRIPEDPRGAETPSPIRWRDASLAPKIVDPEVGRLWSANSRHVEGELESVLGNDEAAGGMLYDTGIRARQIRDRLLALESLASPEDMLSIQLEDRALMLERWQTLLVELLDDQALVDSVSRAEFLTAVRNWGGRAASDSVGYRLVRAFRLETRRATWNMLLNALDVEPGQPPALFEQTLWQLVTERPVEWLADPKSADWREFLLHRVDAVIASLEPECQALTDCTWGRYNTTQIRHPLSAALGPLATGLDYPARALDGDINVPRVTGRNFGASERFAVSPGRESEGYLHLPGGPSGHPLSPFYRGDFERWVKGEPAPLLPGPTQHELRLRPPLQEPVP